MRTLANLIPSQSLGPAWPVDLFRRCLCLLAVFYFASLLFEAGSFTQASGLIDHRLSLEIFPYTLQPLFSDATSAGTIRCVFSLAMLLSFLAALGFQTRLFAFWAYAIAVCTYRWNFLVLYVDDVFMHLFLLWVVLLPDGKTRFLAPHRSLSDRVPYFRVKLFLLNMSLMYLIAGGSKWFSPMWLDGTAVFAIQKLSFTRFPEFWQLNMLPWTKFLTWSALFVEPLLALTPWLRVGSPLKWILGLLAAGLHFFTILSLGFVFANVGCLCFLILAFAEELKAFFRQTLHWTPKLQECAHSSHHKIMDALTVFMVVCLVGAMGLSFLDRTGWRSVAHSEALEKQASVNPESGGKVQTLFYSALWVLGLAQSYQLLDWIDSRNHTIALDAELSNEHGHEMHISNIERWLPTSVRMNLIYSYIFGVTWHYVPFAKRELLKQSLARRIAENLCRHNRALQGWRVQLQSSFFRVSPAHQDSYQAVYRKKPLLNFSCGVEGLATIPSQQGIF